MGQVIQVIARPSNYCAHNKIARKTCIVTIMRVSNYVQIIATDCKEALTLDSHKGLNNKHCKVFLWVRAFITEEHVLSKLIEEDCMEDSSFRNETVEKNEFAQKIKTAIDAASNAHAVFREDHVAAKIKGVDLTNFTA